MTDRSSSLSQQIQEAAAKVAGTREDMQPTNGTPLTTEGHHNCCENLRGLALGLFNHIDNTMTFLANGGLLKAAVGAMANHAANKWQKQILNEQQGRGQSSVRDGH